MTCTNTGTGAATGATCAITSGGTASNCTVGGIAVTLPLASLASGASIVCAVSATAPPSGSLTINAATGASNDTGTAGKTAAQVVGVTGAPPPPPPPGPSPGATQPIPTLSEWAVMLLSLLLAGIGGLRVRRVHGAGAHTTVR
jgi:hypothetical protein